MKLVHWVNLLLLAALVGFAGMAWGALPERIPVHFGVDGEPTRWARPGLLSWFGLPMLAVATTAMVYWVARMLSTRPHLLNMPDKDRFLALPAERRGPVLDRAQEFMYWVAAFTIAIMGIVQGSMYRAALDGSVGRGMMVAILAMSVLMGPLLLVLWARMVQPELDRQVLEHRAERPAPRR